VSNQVGELSGLAVQTLQKMTSSGGRCSGRVGGLRSALQPRFATLTLPTPLLLYLVSGLPMGCCTVQLDHVGIPHDPFCRYPG